MTKKVWKQMIDTKMSWKWNVSLIQIPYENFINTHQFETCTECSYIEMEWMLLSDKSIVNLNVLKLYYLINCMFRKRAQMVQNLNSKFLKNTKSLQRKKIKTPFCLES